MMGGFDRSRLGTDGAAAIKAMSRIRIRKTGQAVDDARESETKKSNPLLLTILHPPSITKMISLKQRGLATRQ